LGFIERVKLRGCNTYPTFNPDVCRWLQVQTFQRLNEQQRVAACGDHDKALMILAGE
jgi:hypothetical protein